MIKKFFLSIGIFLLLMNPSYSENGYIDIDSDDWYYEDLNFVVNDSRQILKGYPDGTFKPKKELTVEEFTKCIILAAELSVAKEKGDSWSKPFLDKAIEKKYILKDEFERYDRPITRGEMARMIIRSVEDITGEYYYRDTTFFEEIINDYQEINEDFQPYIIKVYDIGVIGGYPDGEFKSNNLLTRAEAVKVIKRLIDSSSRLQVNSFDSEDRTKVIVKNIEDLNKAEEMTRKGNLIILVKDGIYTLNDQFVIHGENITIKSYSGNAENVVIRGKGMSGNVPHIFSVYASNFTVEDLTLGWVKNHGIQVHGENNVDNFTARNIHIRDTYEQMIKVSTDKSKPYYSDNGLIENSTFKYTSGKGPQYYIGGVDAHRAKDWVLRNNTFSNISNPGGRLTEGAIHFWSDSRDTLVEKNVIYNCDRGIMLGLDNSPHYNGIIKNNFISTNKDVGIYLCEAQNSEVYNNTIYVNSSYPNAIEYRYNTEGSKIINNLVNKEISKRNGGTGIVKNNIDIAEAKWFTDVSKGDLHINSDFLNKIANGIKLEEVIYDIDGKLRNNNSIGADE